MVDILAGTFSAKSSLNNSNLQFFTFKTNTEKQKLNFKSNNYEEYNQPFTPAELKEAIQTSHNTVVGLDEIHYDFLEHQSKISLDYFLTIYNDIWINSRFPESWKIATILPKPGKDGSDLAFYQPTVQTDCLCETMEHIGLVSWI